MEIKLVETFLLSVVTGVGIRALFIPDAWYMAWKIVSEISHVFRKNL